MLLRPSRNDRPGCPSLGPPSWRPQPSSPPNAAQRQRLLSWTLGDAKWASSDLTRSASQAHDMFLNHQTTTLKLGTPAGPFTGFGNIADPMSATKEGDEGGPLAVSAVDDFSRFAKHASLALATSLSASAPLSGTSTVSICIPIYLSLHASQIQYLRLDLITLSTTPHAYP